MDPRGESAALPQRQVQGPGVRGRPGHRPGVSPAIVRKNLGHIQERWPRAQAGSHKGLEWGPERKGLGGRSPAWATAPG